MKFTVTGNTGTTGDPLSPRIPGNTVVSVAPGEPATIHSTGASHLLHFCGPTATTARKTPGFEGLLLRMQGALQREGHCPVWQQRAHPGEDRAVL